MKPVDEKPTVTGSHLELTAVVPGIDARRFAEIAEAARSGCVMSRAINAEITLDAKLSG
jgi:osmotically inducible protein OsmC